PHRPRRDPPKRPRPPRAASSPTIPLFQPNLRAGFRPPRRPRTHPATSLRPREAFAPLAAPSPAMLFVACSRSLNPGVPTQTPSAPSPHPLPTQPSWAAKASLRRRRRTTFPFSGSIANLPTEIVNSSFHYFCLSPNPSPAVGPWAREGMNSPGCPGDSVGREGFADTLRDSKKAPMDLKLPWLGWTPCRRGRTRAAGPAPQRCVRPQGPPQPCRSIAAKADFSPWGTCRAVLNASTSASPTAPHPSRRPVATFSASTTSIPSRRNRSQQAS
ncbi:MAG: hypothetical protein RL153_1545, partial [Verrucomicrobiota bacterium]